MLFITNRVPQGSLVSQPGRDFAFDEKDHTPSPSMFFCECDQAASRLTELGSDVFIDQILASPCPHMLFLLHGFANQPQEVIACAQRLQSLCDQQASGQIQVIPLIWPCAQGASIYNNYWSDRDAASASSKAFSRVIMRLYDGFTHSTMPCKTLHILAHSMGNFALSRALQEWRIFAREAINQPFFKNAFLVAADIADDALEQGKEGELICEKSVNVLVYFARDDVALAASKIVNGNDYYRLGAGGPAYYTRLPANVFAINCGVVNQQSDSLLGHSYFTNISDATTKPGKVAEHIVASIVQGVVARTPFL